MWIYEEDSWMQDAACRGLDPNLWFLPDELYDIRMEKLLPGLAICKTCPVVENCLDMAIREDWVQSGIFGGKTSRQRQSIKRKRQRMSA